MEKQLSDLKKIHDYHATTIHILRTRIQFYYEEFPGILELTAFLEQMCKELKAKIEELEPKVEPKAEVEQ